MTDRELMQQALEALEEIMSWEENAEMTWAEKADRAITVIRSVLAQPEQEPVANNPDPYHLSRILHHLAGAASMCWEHVDRAGVFQSTQAAEFVAEAIDEIRQCMKAAPPQRKPLTEEEIYECERVAAIRHQRHKNSIRGQQITAADNPQWHFARAIERAHGIGEKE